jgi:hypothetical protein
MLDDQYSPSLQGGRKADAAIFPTVISTEVEKSALGWKSIIVRSQMSRLRST